MPLFATLRDDGLYNVECKRGHRACTVVQNPLFELLADSAALALRDEYYREAVVSFTASLEAFWGFYVRVVALHLGAQHEMLEQFRKDTKLSERRVGAMYFAHLALTKTRYVGDPEKRRTFRNHVVHDGTFPTPEEALDYAAYVYETISDGLEQLKRLAQESMERVIAIEVGRGRQTLRDRGVQEAISTTFVGTLLSHGYAHPRRLFADVFREWSELNAWDLCDEYAIYESLAQGPDVEGKGD